MSMIGIGLSRRVGNGLRSRTERLGRAAYCAAWSSKKQSLLLAGQAYAYQLSCTGLLLAGQAYAYQLSCTGAALMRVKPQALSHRPRRGLEQSD